MIDADPSTAATLNASAAAVSITLRCEDTLAGDDDPSATG
jgi:hypothetical protein